MPAGCRTAALIMSDGVTVTAPPARPAAPGAAGGLGRMDGTRGLSALQLPHHAEILGVRRAPGRRGSENPLHCKGRFEVQGIKIQRSGWPCVAGEEKGSPFPTACLRFC